MLLYNSNFLPFDRPGSISEFVSSLRRLSAHSAKADLCAHSGALILTWLFSRKLPLSYSICFFFLNCQTNGERIDIGFRFRPRAIELSFFRVANFFEWQLISSGGAAQRNNHCLFSLHNNNKQLNRATLWLRNFKHFRDYSFWRLDKNSSNKISNGAPFQTAPLN